MLSVSPCPVLPQRQEVPSLKGSRLLLSGNENEWMPRPLVCPQPQTCQGSQPSVVSMARRVFLPTMGGARLRGSTLVPAATPLAFGNQLKPSEGLGACLESSELLHRIQGFPGGLREFINLTSTGYLCQTRMRHKQSRGFPHDRA